MSRILLADDDENLRPALQKSLESLGYQVLPAKNGRIAFEIFKKIPVDLVISDIRMPEMDGLELTRQIKAHRPIPIILITGFAEILETHQAHELGADEFLAKPFERGDLIEAIKRCLTKLSGEAQVTENEFCRLALEDFVSGRQIQYNIFARLSEKKFVKIAHQGEDLSVFRVKAYKEKNVNYLFLRKDDFRKYVGFNLNLTQAARNNSSISNEKKMALVRHTGEILLEQVRRSGLDEETFDGSRTFVETAIEALMEDDNIFVLLESLNQHADFIFAHSMGVSMYSVLLARAVDWRLPTNSFKIAVAGILHEIGLKELERELLLKPRGSWSVEEVKRYETHPTRGVEILGQIKSVSADVLEIIKQHHENVKGHGFPSRLKRAAIHPMAKLVAVADEFCDRVINNPNGPGIPPAEALAQMRTLCADKLDPQFFEALVRTFAPPSGGNA